MDEKIYLENTVWHWYPWKRLNYEINSEGKTESVCADINHSVHDFPNFIWNVDELPIYALVLHFIGALYFFAITALIINDYFVPTVQVICDSLNLKEVSRIFFIILKALTPLIKFKIKSSCFCWWIYVSK